MDGKFMENLFQKMRNDLKNIYICMDNSSNASMENLSQSIHGKFVPKDAQYF